jgi:hypothetical protein
MVETSGVGQRMIKYFPGQKHFEFGCVLKIVSLFYPAQALSEDVSARFDELFAYRITWSHADITPYLLYVDITRARLNGIDFYVACRDVASETLTIEKMLFKHTRQFTQDGVKMYTKR